jgi:hypothetical protein
MSNMSYVRFENTVRDVEDCIEHIGDALSPSEEAAREKLVALCIVVLEESGYVVTNSAGVPQ